MLAGYIERITGKIQYAWSITFFVLAGLFVVFSFYHRIFLPKPVSDTPNPDLKAMDVIKEFGKTIGSFFRKPQLFATLFFILTFRFAEAQLQKLINPFLLDPIEKGGLGLSTEAV